MNNRRNRLRARFWAFALCLLTVAFASRLAVGANDDARNFLLSSDFFSDFYGTDSVSLLQFDETNRDLDLSFKTRRFCAAYTLPHSLKALFRITFLRHCFFQMVLYNQNNKVVKHLFIYTNAQY